MLFDEFIKVSSDYWNEYFRVLQKAVVEGRTNLGDNIALFPQILLCTKTDHHYLAELVGADRKFSKLAVKRHVNPSINQYFNQFDYEESETPMWRMENNEGVSIGDVILTNADLTEVRSRFPFANLERSSTFKNIHPTGPVIRFNASHLSSNYSHTLLINSRNAAIRVRSFAQLSVIHKGFTKHRYLEFLRTLPREQGEIVGATVVGSSLGERMFLASQFSSLYLTNRLRETTIGEFLRLHPEILRTALGSKRFVTEAYLPWIESGDGNCDDAINPDLFIERDDGYYDIYDLKTAALEKKSLTKGSRARRRFIDYVNEGIAQLTNYEEYFAYPQNREFARAAYDVEVKNPNLVLVVGSFENAKADEIKEACKAFRNITIVDYSTLMTLFADSGKRSN